MSINVRFACVGVFCLWGMASFLLTAAIAMHLYALCNVFKNSTWHVTFCNVMATTLYFNILVGNAVAITVLNELFRWRLISPGFQGHRALELAGRTFLGSVGIGLISALFLLFLLQSVALLEICFIVMVLMMSAIVVFGALVGWNCLPFVVRQVADAFSSGVGSIIRPPRRRRGRDKGGKNQ